MHAPPGTLASRVDGILSRFPDSRFVLMDEAQAQDLVRKAAGHVASRSVSTSKQTYAEILSAVNTLTTLPLVLNFFLCRPSSPTSEKNCLFPDACQLGPP